MPERNRSDNLIHPQDRTPKERAEMGKKGGIASGESRRQRKKLRDCAIELMALPVTNGAHKKMLKRLGIDEEEMSNGMLVVAKLFKAASTGDVWAAKELRRVLGEDREPIGDDEGLAKLDEMLNLARQIAEDKRPEVNPDG